MVFPRPGGPCLCGHSSSSSSRCRPSGRWFFPWCFPIWGPDVKVAKINSSSKRKKEPKASFSMGLPNVTSETHRKWCFWLLFPLAAAMNFSYLYIRSPNGKTPWKKSPPGGETPCLWRTEKPQNCTPKMPNVTSETHRKWCFWLLFPLAAAMNFSYLYIRSPNGKTPWKKSPPGGETPCLWRTEKPQNCTPKMPNVTSETHRKWCFWLLFPLAVAMWLLWSLATFTSGP